MEIVYSAINTVELNSLEIGAVFKYANEYYIKTHWIESGNCCGNALRVDDMMICSFKDGEDVIPCQAKLHIIKEGNS